MQSQSRLILNLLLWSGIACAVPYAHIAYAESAADDPPANPDPTLAADQAKAVSKAVKQNVKVAVDATKEGAQKVAETAKEVAHEVAETTKEGAQEVAATAKRGTEKTKAALNGSKSTPKPAEKPEDKPATP
jgi:hypothetical protein